MIPISNLVLNVHDGNTIVSTDVYGVKTYANIGSGNVLYLDWDLYELPNDTLSHYKVVIKRFAPTVNVYYDILDKNVGKVSNFYVKADMLPAIPLEYVLSIYVVAFGKKGSVITSNVVNPYVCKGSGTYVKVTYDDYKTPIMKRALAFVKAPTPIEEVPVLVDSTGRKLFAADKDEEPLAAKATKLLASDTWAVVQESYTKGSDGTWHTNDIKFEVLVAGGSDVDYGTIIEVITGYDTSNNPIFEPLYVL